MKARYKLILLVVLSCLCSIIIYRVIDRVKAVQIVPDLLSTQHEKELSFLESTSYEFDDPKVILNPYGISPLAALVIFETKDLTTPSITVQGKDDNSTFTHTFTPGKKHILPVYGLYPNQDNVVLLQVNGDTKKIMIHTDPLPNDFILPTKVTSDKSKLDNELYFYTPSSIGYTAAYDVNGDVRWYLSDRFLWDIQRLDNGHLLLSSNRLINPPYYTTGLVEIDLLGKIYYEYDLPGGYHHDVFEMKDGNFLIASNDFANGTVEDSIALMDRDTGKILDTFDLSKILPTNQGRNAYTTEYDWFHNNSVWYDEKTNSITLSGRHVDAVVNIDYDTKEINWIFGDSTGWSDDMKKYFFKPSGDSFEWQWAQHAAMILPNGDLFLFDNGNNKSKNKEEYVDANDSYSRGVIYRLNTNTMTAQQVWEYGKERGSSYYSPYISDVDYLGKNHYLVHSGGHSVKDGSVNNEPAGLTKVDYLNTITTELLDDQIIFEMELPTNSYRAEKMSLYANDRFVEGKGVHLGNMGVTPTSPKQPWLIFTKNDQEVLKKYDISIQKEFDRLVVKGTYKKDDKIQIVLDNTFDKKVYDVRVSKLPYTAMCIDIFNEEEKQNGISVTKYINDEGIKGKYYIYIKINDKIYDTKQYVNF